MKRTKRIACLLMIATLLLSTCSTAFAKVGNIYVVKGDGLHLRSNPHGGAGNEGNILGSLRRGKKVVHLGSYGNWWKVRTESSKVGWVFNSYLAPSSVKSKDAGTVTKKSAGSYHVKCSVLNVRAEANTNSKVLGRLGKGRKVNVLAVKDGWGKIKNSKGQVGYVAMRYVG